MSRARVVVATVACLCAAVTADPAGWRDEVFVGGDVSVHTGLSVGVDDTLIHIAGTTTSASECSKPWYARSTDWGVSWEPVITLPAGTNAYSRDQIALTVDGGCVTILVPMSGHTLLNILRHHSTDQGVTWQDYTYAGKGHRPTMASLFDTRYAVWDHDRYVVRETELFFKRSLDGGCTWGPPPGQGVEPDDAMRLTDAPGRSEYADICTEYLMECGYVIVVWSDNRPGGTPPPPSNLYINWSGTGGESWAYAQEGRQVWESPIDSRYPAIDCYEPAYPWTLHLVWQEGENQVYYARSSDRGATWNSVGQIGEGYHPDVAVDADGVHVVWWTEGEYSDVIRYRQSADFGQTWEDVPILVEIEESGSPARMVSSGQIAKGEPREKVQEMVDGGKSEGTDGWYAGTGRVGPGRSA